MAVTVAEAFATIRPDLSKFKGELEGGLKGFDFGGIAKTAALGVAAVATAAVAAGGLVIHAAMEEQQGMIQLAQAARQAGVDWDSQGAAVEKLVTKWERMSSVADGEIRPAFALMIAQTGDLNTAIDRMPLALDVARGANIDLATSARLLGKLSEENVSVFARMGVVVKKGATEAEVLAAVQQKFGGQAAAYAQSAAGSFAAVQNEFNNLMEDIGMALLPAFTEALRGILGFMETLRDSKDFQTFIENVKKVMGSLGEMIAVITGLSPSAGGVLRTLVGDQQAEAIMKVLAGIREAFKAIMAVVGPVLGFIAEHFDLIAAVVLPPLLLILGGIVKAFLAAKIAAIGMALGTATAMLPVIVPLVAIGAAIWLLWKNWDKVTAFMQGAADALGKGLQGVADWIGKAFAGLGDVFANLGSFFANLGPNISNALSGIGSAIGGLVQRVLGGLGSLFKPIVDLWNAFAQNPARAIGLALGSIIGGFLRIESEIGKFVRNALDAFLKWAGESKTAIGNFIGSIPGAVGTWLSQTLGNIQTFAANAISSVGAWVSQTWTSVSSFFLALPGNIWNWLTQVISNVVAFGQQAGAAFGTWISTTWTTISSFFTTLPGRMWSFAVQAVQGLLGGFGSMVEGVKTAIGNFFGGIVDGIKGALGIHSPSKVFADIGSNMMRGLSSGIARNANLPQRALDNIELTAPNPLGGVAAGGRVGGGVNVTVGPINLSYTGKEDPVTVHRMAADTIDYITRGLSEQLTRIGTV